MATRFTSYHDALQACKTIEGHAPDFITQYVDESVNWTVTEPTGTSTPISGVYTTRDAFVKGALLQLSPFFVNGEIKMQVVDIVFQNEGDDGVQKVALELVGSGTVKKTGKEWKNYYTWVMHFKEKKAFRVRAYLDSVVVNTAMEASPKAPN